MRNPLLLVSAALAGGIFLQRWMFLREQEYLLVCGVLLLCAAATLKLDRRSGAIAFAIFGIALSGSFFLTHWEHWRAPDDIEGLVAGHLVELNEPARFTGWICDEQVVRNTDEIYQLRLEEVESAQRNFHAAGTIRLQHYRWEKSEPRANLHYGDRLSVLTRLRRIRGFANPGGFDTEARARRQGVLYAASIKAVELTDRLPGRRGNWLAAGVYQLRRALLDRLDALFPANSVSNSVLRAMLLGDRSGLDRGMSEDFQKTGTYHALVVAGLHTGAIAAFLLLLLRWMRVPPFPATLLAIAGLALFAALAGANTPTVRAAVMFSLYLLARLIYRERALLNTIALTALLLLVLQPADLNDAGFQLSFFSVLLIASVAIPWIERTSTPYRYALADLDNRDRELTMLPKQAQFRIEMRMLCDAFREKVPAWFVTLCARTVLRIYELLVVSFVLQVGFLLPMAVYFHRAGWVAVAANFFIVPLLTVAVPLGAVMLLVALVSKTLAGLLAIPVAALVEMMAAVVRWHAGLGLASFRVPQPPVWVSCAFLLALCLVAAGLLARRSILVWAGVPVAVLAAVLITWHPFAPQLPARELEFTALDVGQGDALVVLAPPGRVMVEDCGGLPMQSATDTGEEIVSPYLWSRGIRHIDVLAVTHAHQDHVGGMEAILANFSVGEIWLPPVKGSEPYARVVEMAEARHIPLRIHSSGETEWFGGAAVAFLSPPADYHVGRRAQNNDSLVMRLSYGNRTVLLPGDIERKMEMQLVGSGAGLPSDLLKVPHHGAKTSNSSEFLQEVRAAFAVISVAENSPFGHPHQEALDRLAEARTRIFRTDQDGAVTWATDGRRVRMNTFRWNHPRAAIDLW